VESAQGGATPQWRDVFKAVAVREVKSVQPLALREEAQVEESGGLAHVQPMQEGADAKFLRQRYVLVQEREREATTVCE